MSESLIALKLYSVHKLKNKSIFLCFECLLVIVYCFHSISLLQYAWRVHPKRISRNSPETWVWCVMLWIQITAMCRKTWTGCFLSFRKRLQQYYFKVSFNFHWDWTVLQDICGKMKVMFNSENKNTKLKMYDTVQVKSWFIYNINNCRSNTNNMDEDNLAFNIKSLATKL